MAEKKLTYREIFLEEGKRLGEQRGMQRGMVKGCITAFQSLDLPTEVIITKIMEMCHLDRRQALEALKEHGSGMMELGSVK